MMAGMFVYTVPFLYLGKRVLIRGTGAVTRRLGHISHSETVSTC